MTAEELQDAIFQKRLAEDGEVSLGELPSVAQLNWLLYIDEEKDYMNYTSDMALEDMILYFSYQNKKRRIKQGEYW